MLDRAASDPLWKQRLLNDPEAAMREADFPELKRLDEIRQQEEEVRGHLVDLMTLDGAFDYYRPPRCRPSYTRYYAV